MAKSFQLRSCLLVVFLLLTTQIATAQEAATSTATPDESSATTVRHEDLDTLKGRIEAATELSEEDRKAALEAVQQGVASLNLAKEFADREKLDRAALKQIDAERRKLEAELDALQTDSANESLPAAELSQLEQNLAEKQSTLAQMQAKLDQTQNSVNTRSERQRIIKERIAAIPQDKDAVLTQLDQLPSVPDAGLVAEAKRLALLAEQKRLEAEPTKLQAELSLMSAREAAGLSQLTLQIQGQTVDRLKKSIQKLTTRINTKRRSDARSRRETAVNKATQYESSEDPLIQDLTPVMLRTVEIIDDELKVQQDFQKDQTHLTRVDQDFESLRAEFDQLQRREDRIGSSRSFGIRLRQQRSTLPNPSSIRRQIQQRATGFEATELKYFDYREELQQLDAKLDNILELVPVPITNSDLPDQQLAEWEQAYQAQIDEIRAAFQLKRDALERVITSYENYTEQLDSLDASQTKVAQLSESFADFIDRRVLWIRSHEAFSWQTVTGDADSLRIFVDQDKWKRILTTLQIDFWGHLFLYSLFIVIWTMLLVTQSRQSQQITKMSKKASSRLNTSMRPTARALLMTFTKSVILPLPILFIAWRLYRAEVSMATNDWMSPHLFTLSANLTMVGMVAFALEFVRSIHRPMGVAQVHFGWPETACRLVYSQIGSLLAFLLPVLFAIAVLDAWTGEGESEAVRRTFSIGGYILLAHSMHILINPKQGAFSKWIDKSENEWVDRFSSMFYYLLLAIPLAMAVLTAVGFTYATDRLAVKLAQSLAMLCAVLLGRAMLLKALTMRHRRIAIEQSRKARAALAGASESTAVPKSGLPEVQDDKAKLLDVSMQTRRLLGTSVVVLTIVGIWWIWNDVLPALHYFDEWALPGTSLRLPSIISAIVVGILTATAARNIPGLLEMTLLEWLPLERSIRYAIAAITQYLIAIIGLLAISERIDLTWEKVQWLAAALTFGLGFGLQEIFANFVSGLIILFEQPVRVGDVVTIDGVTGIVNRIRIRSTTITDWDRKDYVVPNREFITGKLLNWTLSDTTNRVVINVGVAYGSDPVAVRDLIMKILHDHPLILKDPEPLVVFEAFGDSSLNFSVRLYLPALDRRLHTIHDLHVAINNGLNEAGIEIPFPQRDLHIRSTVDIPHFLRTSEQPVSSTREPIENGHESLQTSETERG